MYTGATSSFGGGRSNLTATPWQRDTNIEDVRKFSGFGQAGSQQAALAPRSYATTPRPSMPEENSGIGKKLEQEALRQARAAANVAEARARAMTMGAPTKQLYGFNMSGRVMDDPENLSGAQREVFLPENASIVDGGCQPGRGVSFTMPGVNDAGSAPASAGADSGYNFRAAQLADAQLRSDAEYTARRQQQAMHPQGQPISYRR